jgi:branched-chain amino acid transport system permease protein
VGLFGALVERFLLRKLEYGALGHIGQILLTLGLAMIILHSVRAFWGSEPLVITIPQSLDGFVAFAGLKYPVYRLFIIVLSFVILTILALMLFTTRLGMIVRAAVSDAEMVSALGINIPFIFTFVFAMGTWMAGVAGVAASEACSVPFLPRWCSDS